jgi:putative ABC transport system permease protein
VRLVTRLRHLWLNLTRRTRVDEALDNELRAYVDLLTAEYESRGLAPAAARRNALVDVGGVERVKDAARDEWIGAAVATGLRELRYALRSLRGAPGFVGTSVATLALGIGGASAVFTVVNGVLLRPLPYPHAERLVDLSHTLAVAGVMHVGQSDATFFLYQRDNRVFTDVGIYRATSVNLHAGTEGANEAGASQRVSAALATPSVFRVLGAAPIHGRGLGDADAIPGAPPVAVISQQLWENAFGSDPAILGRQVAIDGVDREVIGIAPKTFHYPAEQTQLWLPLVLDPAHTNSAAFDFQGIARLKDGVTIANAAADLQRLLPQVPVVYPGRLTAAAITVTKMRTQVELLRDVMVGGVSKILWLVLSAVGLLLLLACANVANLFLARVEGRQREFAVRRALGAGRLLLLQTSLGEALVLSCVGGALGIVLAALGVKFLQQVPIGASIPRLAEVHVDGIVITFALAVSCAAALAVSALPAIRLSRASLTSLMSADGRTSTGVRVRHGVRRALVVSQVALALVLVSGAALFARSFQRLSAVNPGFDADHALAFRLAIPAATYPTTSDAAETVVAALRALRALPGVIGAGAASRLPLDAESTADSAVLVEDHPRQPGTIPAVMPMMFVTPGYFRSMGIPLVAGRLFGDPDPSLDPARIARELLVSEAFALRYWTAAEAVGKRIRMNPTDPWSTIVGVVGSTHDAGLAKPAVAEVYSQLVSTAANGKAWTPRDVAFVLRTSGDAADISAGVRSAVRSVAPALPVYRLIALRSLLQDAEARTTFTVMLLGIAAVVALMIGTMGIYGVVAFLVALRTREIGLRLALGAQPSDVRRMIVRRALADAAIGVAVGVGGAIALTQGLATLLYSVKPTDPVSLLSAGALLLLTALVASWIPARRAARLEPATALREA